MTKRDIKIVEYHRNTLMKHCRDEIQSDVSTIRRILETLADLATYNAEMEEPEIRAIEADDMRRSIEYRLESITENVKSITRQVKEGWKMQEWFKWGDECHAHFLMTEEELEALHKREGPQESPRLTDEELAEIREAERMEILSDPNEDPPLTEEEERAYEQRIDEYLARLDRIDDDPYDIDPAYDPSYRWFR